jgi:UDP-N-acetylglucosamine 1-carboxyvinyltransferase
MHVSELTRLGADIEIEGPSAIVKGWQAVERGAGHGQRFAGLGGAGDRGLAARGTTQVNRVYHIDRGYEKFSPAPHAPARR